MLLMYGWDPRYVKKETIVILEEETRLPPTVRSFVVETPVQLEILVRKLAWETVLQDVTLKETKGGHRYFSLFQKSFETAHFAAKLLLSDAADYGVTAVKNAFLSRGRSTRSALSLAGVFSQVPAIIVGAGPSLPKLGAFADKALIFAGGRALDRIDVEPHFAAAIDKEGPIKKMPGPDVPFCFQSRLNPSVLSRVQGPLLRAPEPHFSFLRWLEGESEPFDAGWTVGNFLAALAAKWGCNPIIAVGMDFCYEKLGEGQLKGTNQQGKVVSTQSDWIMGAHWMKEFAKKQEEIRWIDGCGRGLDLGWKGERLEEIELPRREGLREEVKKAVARLPERRDMRWEEWKNKLQGGEEALFETLWEVWKPIFEGKGDLTIHRTLFLEQVRKEHLDVLR